MAFPAFGVITGVVSEDSTVKPGGRVACLDRSTMRLVDTVTTGAAGEYRFEFLDPAKKYLIVAVDDPSVNTYTPPSQCTGRFVRLALGGSKDDSYVGLGEVEIAATPGGPALTTPASPARASTQYSTGAAYAAAKALDGVTTGDNDWVTNMYTRGVQHWQVDLGSVQTLYEVRVYPNFSYPSRAPTAVELQTSVDGVKWVASASYAINSAWAPGVAKTFLFLPAAASTTYNEDAKNAVVADYVVPVEGFRRWDAYYWQLVRLSAGLGEVFFFDGVRPRTASNSYSSPDWANRYIGASGYTGVCYPLVAGGTQAAIPSPYPALNASIARQLLQMINAFWAANVNRTLLAVLELPDEQDAFVLAAFDMRVSPRGMGPNNGGVRVTRRGVLFQYHDGATWGVFGYTPATPLPPKFAFYLVITGAAKLELFIDGTLVASSTDNAGASYAPGMASTTDLLLAAAANTEFPVKVSCAGYVNAALSAAQIQDLHDKRVTLPPLVTRTYADTMMALRPVHYAKLDNSDVSQVIDEVLGAPLTKSTAGTTSAATGFTPGVGAVTFSGAFARTTVSYPTGGVGPGFAVALCLRMTALPTALVTLTVVTNSLGQIHDIATVQMTVGGVISCGSNRIADFNLTGPLALNTDYFLVVQRTASVDGGSLSQLFVNGKEHSSLTGVASESYGPPSATGDSTRQLIIGAARAGAGAVSAPFNGTLGHVALFNRGLTAEEVATLYAARTL